MPVLLWKIRLQDELSSTVMRIPEFYRKEMLEVELNGKPVNAMVYVMNDGREFGALDFICTPSPSYESAGLIQIFWIRRWKTNWLAQEQQAVEDAVQPLGTEWW